MESKAILSIRNNQLEVKMGINSPFKKMAEVEKFLGINFTRMVRTPNEEKHRVLRRAKDVFCVNGMIWPILGLE